MPVSYLLESRTNVGSAQRGRAGARGVGAGEQDTNPSNTRHTWQTAHQVAVRVAKERPNQCRPAPREASPDSPHCAQRHHRARPPIAPSEPRTQGAAHAAPTATVSRNNISTFQGLNAQPGLSGYAHGSQGGQSCVGGVESEQTHGAKRSRSAGSLASLAFSRTMSFRPCVFNKFSHFWQKRGEEEGGDKGAQKSRDSRAGRRQRAGWRRRAPLHAFSVKRVSCP